MATTAGAAPPAMPPVLAPPPIVRLPEPAPAPAPAEPTTPATLRVSAAGESLIIEGNFLDGTAARFASLVARTPRARIVVLHSGGGLIGEAERLADIVRAHRLDTYVEGACLSACTLVLIAGQDRAAAPNARIGFHRPRFPASARLTDRMRQDGWRVLYDNAGVAPAFTDRVVATPFEQMWYPSLDEMRAAHVLTRMTLGGETSAITSVDSREALERMFREAPIWRSINEHYPAVAARAIDAAWAARQRGGTDSAVMDSARAVLVRSAPIIMAGASDAVLDQYLQLIIEQGEAARRVSIEACTLLLRGQLNAVATLPPELSTRELALLTQAMEAPPTPRPPPNEDAAQALMTPLFRRLSEPYRNAIGAPEAQTDPRVRCDAFIAFFHAISELGQRERTTLTRFMFLSPHEDDEVRR